MEYSMRLAEFGAAMLRVLRDDDPADEMKPRARAIAREMGLSWPS